LRIPEAVASQCGLHTGCCAVSSARQRFSDVVEVTNNMH
jgi:hypothetical protein